MSMPTLITFDERRYSDPGIIVYGVWNYMDLPEIEVYGYNKGIITISPPEGTNIKVFAEFISGIFHPKSNFASTICEMYKVPVEDFRGVKFDFNNVVLTITRFNNDPKQIYDKWRAEYKKVKNNKWGY